MVKTERRPSTATLIKPTLLDTKLLGIFDMSTVSREHLLAIKNLVHSTPRCKCKPMSKAFSLKCESDANESSDPKMQKMYKVLNKTYCIRTNVRQRLRDFSADTADEILDKVPIIPSPCITCGRQDQPERFHSHPSRMEMKEKTKEQDERKIVHKPIAMKFKSNKSRILEANEDKEKVESNANHQSQSSSTRCKENKSPKHSQKMSEPIVNKENVPKMKIKLTSKWREAFKKTVQHKRELTGSNDVTKLNLPVNRPESQFSEGGYKLGTWNPAPVSGGRKRKVVCYLCSQEFGTAVLPSHEAQCIQKYLKEASDCDNKTEDTENDASSSSEAQENWKLAWEITQASLVPCEYCDRKFLPARLESHEKICSSKSNKTKVSFGVNSSQPGVLCEHCGKRYGSSSISIHREQCAKKCKIAVSPEQTFLRKTSAPPTVICYICGRNFGTKSIAFHEPHCLKKWKLENEKLPPHLQVPLPVKAEHASASEDQNCVNLESQEIFWKAHQAQLVPCPKCARTFYPDRLEIHLKICKGPSKNKSK